MDEKQKQFDELVKDLTALGEDKDELAYWQTIFEFLTETDKDDMLTILKNEKEELSKI
jgi:hypothetical protein